MNDLSVEEFLQSCKNGSPSEKACDNFILDKWESHEKRRMKQDQDLIKELDKLPKRKFTITENDKPRHLHEESLRGYITGKPLKSGDC